MKICAYVLTRFAKQNYKNESYNIRINAGMQVVIDILKRIGYSVDFAGSATVHNYDVVLWQCTSDCDWWEFLAERARWKKGNYKVVVGGAGVLNVRPFLPYVDYFVLGRAEGIIEPLIKALDACGDFEHESVVNSKTFSVDKKYFINQVECTYPHEIRLENGKIYKEGQIGCNHKCFFCGYSWQRKHTGQPFRYGDLWSKNKDVELAILDLNDGVDVDWTKLRTTAIDGLSQRIRFLINKKITRQMIQQVITNIGLAKPHQVKIYNIVGYPTETQDDWLEFLDDLTQADSKLPKIEKQGCIVLHSTPFRAMPCTPLCCAEMSYQNYRGRIAQVLGGGRYKGNIFYKGNSFFAVESMGTDSLSSVIKSAVVWRGTENDTDNIVRIACSKKFENASATVKQLTLEKYFDVPKLFGRYTLDNLPTRYLHTYADAYKVWEMKFADGY